MKIKIGIYMDEYQAKRQLIELLDDLDLTLEDFDKVSMSNPNFILENDYLCIARHSCSDGGRGYRQHFAICSIQDYETKADIIDTIVSPALVQQADLVNAFHIMSLDRKYNLSKNALRAETHRDIHLDIGKKDFLYSSIKVAKAIHEALNNLQ